MLASRTPRRPQFLPICRVLEKRGAPHVMEKDRELTRNKIVNDTGHRNLAVRDQPQLRNNSRWLNLLSIEVFAEGGHTPLPS